MVEIEGTNVNTSDVIVRIILEHYPSAQAIYLFGTSGTEYERPDSEVDIAVLLPYDLARHQPQLALTPCHLALMQTLKKEVDLVNLRQVSTVFQNEIVSTGRRFYCADKYAADEFEMLTLSFYQKLNEERKEVLASFRETGKAYDV